MKQFKDLKIGDKLAYIDTLVEMEIIDIEKVETENDNLNLISIKTNYCNFVVGERNYFEKGGFNNIIAPQENITILHEIYAEGIKTGKKYLANSIKNLLMIK